MRLKERFRPFIRRRGQLKVIYVATCNESGTPNCAPRLIVDIWEPNKIFYIDFKASQSYTNICQINKASLAFMDERSLMSFKINGVCEAISSGKEFDKVKAKWTKTVNSYHAERIIERIKGIISGRAKEIYPEEDYVFVKFTAKKMKEVVAPPPSVYPIEQIAALQLHIDELEEDVKKHQVHENELEISRNAYKASSDVYAVAAMEDSLTGLLNQRGFKMLAEQHLKISKRQKKDVYFISADVDHLKRINDAFGHAEGDKVLMNTAHILKRSFRESDIVARMGGDEFVVAMVDCGQEHLDLAKGRLKKNIEEYNRGAEEAQAIELSIGVASCKPTGTVNLHDLLKQSDQMMYKEKRKKK